MWGPGPPWRAPADPRSAGHGGLSGPLSGGNSGPHSGGNSSALSGGPWSMAAGGGIKGDRTRGTGGGRIPRVCGVSGHGGGVSVGGTKWWSWWW